MSTMYHCFDIFKTLWIVLAMCRGCVVARAVFPCDSLDKYTVEAFLRMGTDLRQYFSAAKLYEPPASTSLFYTKVLSEAARRYSKGGGNHLSTIWDLFPCQLYNAVSTGKFNPLRCIMANETEKRFYFSNISRAMALSCDVSATVMTEDVKKIPMDGIWGVVEHPALTGEGRGGRRVDWIEAIDRFEDDAVTIWERPERFENNAKPPSSNKIEPYMGITQQIMLSRKTARKLAQHPKRNFDHPRCPYVSAAQMERWWNDVNW